jgi:hypothetical protein
MTETPPAIQEDDRGFKPFIDGACASWRSDTRNRHLAGGAVDRCRRINRERPADIHVNASTSHVSCGATHPGRAPAALALVADHAISR